MALAAFRHVVPADISTRAGYAPNTQHTHGHTLAWLFFLTPPF